MSDVLAWMETPPRPTVTQMERGWLLSCVYACGPGHSLHDFFYSFWEADSLTTLKSCLFSHILTILVYYRRSKV